MNTKYMPSKRTAAVKRPFRSKTPKSPKKKSDNTLFYTAAVIFCILLAMLVYRKMFAPPVVTMFACSDFCPGPREQYEVMIYKDVSSTFRCHLIGGKPETINGWKPQTICLAAQ
jgi:hypothetical protein